MNMLENPKRYTITAALPYTNGPIHIGHLAGVYVPADIYSRYLRLQQKDVAFICGSDEHGVAISMKAKKEGISVITVGIGSEEGAPIPEYVFGQLMGYKTDSNGQTVISKRQTLALKNIANETGGSYVDGNNLESSTSQIIDGLKMAASSSESVVKSNNAIHYYQYFLAISIFFFLLIFLLNPRREFNM